MESITNQPIKTPLWLVKNKKNRRNECPIYLRLTQGKSLLNLSTGCTSSVSLWDKRKKRVKGVSIVSKAINDTLTIIEAKIIACINQLSVEGISITPHNVRKRYLGGDKQTAMLLKAYKEYLIRMEDLRGIDYATPTIIKYTSTYDRLESFIKLHHKESDIDVHVLNHSFIEDFISYLKKEYGNSQTTCYKHYQRFSKVVKSFIHKGYLKYNPFEGFTMKLPKKPVEYLTMAEIEKIDNASFEVERLNLIKDIFIFSCYTGLAFRETYNLTPDQIIVDDDGEHWLTITRQKTNKDFKIPLLPKAVGIIEKYRNHPISISRGKLIPIPSNQKMNAYLKEIGDICGIKKKLHHHLARKSFSVSVVLRNSVPIETLSLLLGHSNIKVTVDAYSAISEEKIKKDFALLKKNLLQPIVPIR